MSTRCRQQSYMSVASQFFFNSMNMSLYPCLLYVWFESWDVPKVTGQSTRKSNEISLIQTENLRSHTHEKKTTSQMAKHVIIALDWLQTNYHYEVVYCYIVHSSLWPNARSICTRTQFRFTLTFYFRHFLCVWRARKLF